jgi:hypothetical protein
LTEDLNASSSTTFGIGSMLVSKRFRSKSELGTLASFFVKAWLAMSVSDHAIEQSLPLRLPILKM